MRRVRILRSLALAVLLAACARRPAPVMHPPKPEPSQQLLAQARDSVANGRYAEARSHYLEILENYPDSPAAFQARWGMAWIRVDPKSPLRDYAAARINFDRLVADYGADGGDWRAWAEAWRGVLARLAAAEAEGETLRDRQKALENEIVSLKQDLDRLRALEMDLESKP